MRSEGARSPQVINAPYLKQAVAVPDPIIAYSLDNQPGFLDFGAAGQKKACEVLQAVDR